MHPLSLQNHTNNRNVMHCHIAWHADEGLAVQFLESSDRIGQIENLGLKTCDAWRQYSPNNVFYAKHDSGI